MTVSAVNSRSIALCFCAMLLTACASINVDQDSQAVFGPFQSYAFLIDADNDLYTSLDATRIERALTQELAAKGLTQTDKSSADILVRYDIVEEIRNQSSGFSTGFGLARNNVGLVFATPPDSRQIREGRLVVALVDPEDRRAVWRASGHRFLNESMRTSRRERLINQQIQEMMARFPAQQ